MTDTANETNVAVKDPEPAKEKTPSKADIIAENETLRAELDALRASKAAVQDEASAPGYDPNNPMRPVTIELPFDGEKYKDDLYVHNGNKPPYQIRRGVPVIVPFHIAQTIKESAAQDLATARLISIKEMEFNENIEKLTP